MTCVVQCVRVCVCARQLWDVVCVCHVWEGYMVWRVCVVYFYGVCMREELRRRYQGQ